MHLVFLCLVACCQHPVQTEDQRITSNCTATEDVFMGEPATITCYFNMDLKEHSKSFNVYRYSIDKSEETVLKCFWPAFGKVECDRKADGYKFDGNVSDRLNITITSTSVDSIGKFTCNPEPSYPRDIAECYLMLKPRPETTTTVPIVVGAAGQKNSADVAEKEKEGGSNVGGIVTGVLIAVVVVVVLIVLFVCRKRVLKLIPWCERQREQKETREDVESGNEPNDTVQPLLEENEGDQPGPPDDSITTETVDETERHIRNEVHGRTNEDNNDSGYVDTLKRQNAAALMESAFGTRDLHSDIPVSEGRKEEMSCASHHVTNTQDVHSAIHPATKEGEDIEKGNAEDMNQSAASTNARDGIKQSETAGTRQETTSTSAATNTTLPFAFDPREIRQISADANGGDMQQTTPVLDGLKNTHSFGKSDSRDEEPTAIKELKVNTGGELTEIPAFTQNQEPKPTEAERFSSGNVSLETIAFGDTTIAVPSSQEKESDRWRQTVEEGEHQRRGNTVFETEGCALKPMEKTKRNEAHTAKMPQDFLGACATQHISRDRDERPNLNVCFYQNQIKCQPNGAYIDDIHKEGMHNLDMLENHHAYIQWLFPTSEVPERNRHAQKLYDYEAKAIHEDREAFARFLKSYKMMLHFYGLQLADPNTGEIQTMQDGWQVRFHNLEQNTHNFLRITRILTCLGEMGLEHYKAPFIRHILMETMQGNLLKTLKSCRGFWIETVVDYTEKLELIELFNR